MTKRIVPLALAAVAVVGAACSSSSSSSSSTTAAKTTTTAAEVTTTTAKAATTTTTGTPRCSASMLTVTSGPSNGAAGHVLTPIVFTNSSKTTCTLTGYPGVAGLDGSGSQIAQASRASTGTVTKVALAAGATASATLTNTSVPSGDQASCPTFSGLLVTPPNDTRSTRLSLSLPGCEGFSVAPVVAGSTSG